MKRILIFLLLIPFALATHAQANGTSLDVKAFKAAVERNDALLLDVRTPEEFNAGHIEGAANIDWNAGTLLKDVSGIDKSLPVLLYCEVGGRSGQAMEAMMKAGFTDVHDLAGGFSAWQRNGETVITR
ncbi:MAG: rhodanese-like domain-containing protein [Flavobacteriales bacterium]|jgi:rhodanese-related sulfurtransferase|nr:rhodanese-like domain-containing protein [Flavobacteriales bacterium]MCB0758220.1 rhodanese-like domain-containing protein [Flavobacteriales bacterium]